MPRGIHSTPEFRARACRQVLELSRPIREVAEEMGAAGGLCQGSVCHRFDFRHRRRRRIKWTLGSTGRRNTRPKSSLNVIPIGIAIFHGRWGSLLTAQPSVASFGFSMTMKRKLMYLRLPGSGSSSSGVPKSNRWATQSSEVGRAVATEVHW